MSEGPYSIARDLDPEGDMDPEADPWVEYMSYLSGVRGGFVRDMGEWREDKAHLGLILRPVSV
jgi:hypothetical protein